MHTQHNKKYLKSKLITKLLVETENYESSNSMYTMNGMDIYVLLLLGEVVLIYKNIY
jgi:hypothetical protein